MSEEVIYVVKEEFSTLLYHSEKGAFEKKFILGEYVKINQNEKLEINDLIVKFNLKKFENKLLKFSDEKIINDVNSKIENEIKEINEKLNLILKKINL